MPFTLFIAFKNSALSDKRSYHELLSFKMGDGVKMTEVTISMSGTAKAERQEDS